MNELQEVYRAKDPMQGGLVIALLQQNDIEAMLDGAILASAGGDIPLGWSTAPRVMVTKDDFPKARKIIVEWEAAAVQRAKNEDSGKAADKPAMWTCPECSEEVEYDFEMCWNCQYNRSAC